MDAAIIKIFFCIAYIKGLMPSPIVLLVLLGLVLFYPLRNNKRVLFRILTWAFFVPLSFNLMTMSAGLTYNETESRLISLIVSLVVGVIYIAAPLLINRLQKFKLKFIVIGVLLIFILVIPVFIKYVF